MTDAIQLQNREVVEEFFTRDPWDLIVCAAGMVQDETLFRMTESTWDEVFHLNYTAARECAIAALPRMVEQVSGHIVFISSYAALHPATGQSAYATAKAALFGLTKELAAEYGSHGIRINAILPGFLDTKMTQQISSFRRDEIQNLHALREFNTPKVVADFIWFLNAHLPFTSGQVFQLDSRL